MSSNATIYAALASKIHTLLEMKRTSDAQRILAELKTRNIQSTVLDGLQAWCVVQAADTTTKRAYAYPDEPAHWLRSFEAQWALKREREAVEVLKEGLKHHPDFVDFHLRLSSQYASSGVYELALNHCAAALRVDPTVPEALNRRATVSVITQAPDATEAILALHRVLPERWLEAHKHFLTLGQPADAERVIQEASTQNPEAISPQVGLAKMALWRGNSGPAAALAARLLAEDEHIAEGHALLGMVQSLQRDQGAIEHLQTAHELGLPENSPIESGELICWMAVDCIHHKRWKSAVSWCDLAKARSRSGHPTAFLLRVISFNAFNNFPTRVVNPRWIQHIDRFGPIAADLPESWRETFSSFDLAVQQILENLRGNLSPTPTWVEDGALRGLVPEGLQHHQLRFSQQRIRVQSEADLWSRFEQFMAEYSENPQVYTYSGEVLLWTGRYAEAEALFRQALDRSFLTIWTWIGLGAALGYQGQVDKAFEAFAEGIDVTNFEGPTVFVYRGEFHRQAGRLAEAEADLDVAIKSKPQRLSAWINRVLVDHALGDAAPAMCLSTTLRRLAPGLWWDACEVAGTNPHSLTDVHRALESMLEMMLGNRSSTIITYRAPGKPLRGVRWRRNDIPTELTDRYGVKI
jgi:tetratricopeptide (TPR) repeat protein